MARHVQACLKFAKRRHFQYFCNGQSHCFGFMHINKVQVSQSFSHSVSQLSNAGGPVMFNLLFLGSWAPFCPKMGPKPLGCTRKGINHWISFLLVFFQSLAKTLGVNYLFLAILSFGHVCLGGHRKSSKQVKLSPMHYARCYVLLI